MKLLGNFVRLFCAFVGEKGSAFPVTIERSETVGDLKKAIKLEKANDLKAIDADKLELYLAKKDGAWLKDDDELDTMLLSELVRTTYDLTREEKELPGEYGLDKVLEGLPEPKTREIHVLVVVPKVDAEGARKKSRSVADIEVEKNKFDCSHLGY